MERVTDVDPYDIADIERDVEWDLAREKQMRQRNAENYRIVEMQEDMEDAGIEF